MRVVFMGTPAFAVPCLEALVAEGISLCGVFTKPDQKQGRGQKLQPPPIKLVAEAHGIPVFQPQSLKDGTAVAQLKQLNPTLIIVVAYGKILPLEILTLPRDGCINIHASLLPAYRGAGPIQWSILNGETQTGVTSMYMAEGLDTGDMILHSATPIEANETAFELGQRLAVLGAKTLIDTLTWIKTDLSTRKPAQSQDHNLATYAPMLTKDLCVIDFTKPAQAVHNQIRGLSAWPCAVTTLEQKPLKVYRSELVADVVGDPAQLLCNKTFIVGCGQHTAVRLLEVQYEGGKRMSGQAFLNGRTMPVDTTFLA